MRAGRRGPGRKVPPAAIPVASRRPLLFIEPLEGRVWNLKKKKTAFQWQPCKVPGLSAPPGLLHTRHACPLWLLVSTPGHTGCPTCHPTELLFLLQQERPSRVLFPPETPEEASGGFPCQPSLKSKHLTFSKAV